MWTPPLLQRYAVCRVLSELLLQKEQTRALVCVCVCNQESGGTYMLLWRHLQHNEQSQRKLYHTRQQSCQTRSKAELGIYTHSLSTLSSCGSQPVDVLLQGYSLRWKNTQLLHSHRRL